MCKSPVVRPSATLSVHISHSLRNLKKNFIEDNKDGVPSCLVLSTFGYRSLIEYKISCAVGFFIPPLLGLFLKYEQNFFAFDFMFPSFSGFHGLILPYLFKR